MKKVKTNIKKAEELARARSGENSHPVHPELSSDDAMARLENPFFLMKVACSAHALALAPDKLEDLLWQGRDRILPVSIADVRRAREASALEVLQDLRTALEWTTANTEQSAAEALCHIAYRLVDRLNKLADKNMLFHAPTRISKWPINFAPGASEGASKMKEEVALFNGLKVGSQTLIKANPKSRAGMSKRGKGGWRSETEAAIEAVHHNTNWFLALYELRGISTKFDAVNFFHPKSKSSFLVERFRTPKGRVLVWPWWLENLGPLLVTNPSTGLPYNEQLDDDSVDLFLPVVEGLIVWDSIVGRTTLKLQTRVVDEEEGGEKEMQFFQPELFEKVLRGVRNTLLALAGKPRKKKCRQSLA